jgi:ubiquinone/menaquinone biosynthesis C-methylase UbiE
MFFRRSKNTRDPLAVAMSGVRLGERVLQIGVDDPKVIGLIAAKVGMSGTAACVVADDAAARRVQAGADHVGVLVETATAPFGSPLPLDSGAFDVAVIHSVSGMLASLDAGARATLLREVGRVVRPGGRTIVIESGTQTGLSSLLRGASAAQAAFDQAGGATSALRDAGFFPVRPLGDSEGLKFSEGLRPASAPAGDTARS